MCFQSKSERDESERDESERDDMFDVIKWSKDFSEWSEYTR